MVGKDLLKILKESKYTTVLSGFEMLQENGYPAIRDGEESYDIEQKYGYSVDEMFTSAFYSTRKPQFFEFYRNELLSALDIPPGKGYLAAAIRMPGRKRRKSLSGAMGRETKLHIYT